MVMRRRVCKATNRQGEPCGFTVQREKDLCWGHDPDNAEASQEARRLGGQRRHREGSVAAAYEIDGIATIEALQRLLEVALLDTVALANGVQRNRTIIAVVHEAKDLIQVGDHEQRIRDIESVMGDRLKKDGPR